MRSSVDVTRVLTEARGVTVDVSSPDGVERPVLRVCSRPVERVDRLVLIPRLDLGVVLGPGGAPNRPPRPGIPPWTTRRTILSVVVGDSRPGAAPPTPCKADRPPAAPPTTGVDGDDTRLTLAMRPTEATRPNRPPTATGLIATETTMMLLQ